MNTLRSSIRVNRCIACKHTDIGITCVSESDVMHGCRRCYPEDFDNVAETQKQRWLDGADIDDINEV
jgi:hypothetical protein